MPGFDPTHGNAPDDRTGGDAEGLADELSLAIGEAGLAGEALEALRRAVDEGGLSRYWRRTPERAGWLFDLLDGPTTPRARAFAREALWTLYGGDFAALAAMMNPLQAPEIPALVAGRGDLGLRAGEALRRLAEWAARGVDGAPEALAAALRETPKAILVAMPGSPPEVQAELLRAWRTLPETRRPWPREWSAMLLSPSAAVRWLVLTLIPPPQVSGLWRTQVARMAEADASPMVRKLAGLCLEGLDAGDAPPIWPPEPLWHEEDEALPEVEGQASD